MQQRLAVRYSILPAQLYIGFTWMGFRYGKAVFVLVIILKRAARIKLVVLQELLYHKTKFSAAPKKVTFFQRKSKTKRGHISLSISCGLRGIL